MRIIYYFLFLLLCSACLDEIDELDAPMLETNTSPLIEIKSHTYDDLVRRIRVEFETAIDFSQNEHILGIAVYRNGQARFDIRDHEQMFFIDASLPLGGQVCYTMAYYTDDSDFLPFTDRYCIDL